MYDGHSTGFVVGSFLKNKHAYLNNESSYFKTKWKDNHITRTWNQYLGESQHINKADVQTILGNEAWIIIKWISMIF